MTERDAIIALNMLPKIGPVRVRKMLDFFGSAPAILSAGKDQLLRVDGLGPKSADIVCQWEDHVDLSTELREAQQRGIQLITQQDDNYPSPLRNAYDPPLALYIWGELLERDKHSIAIVGSRRHSHYGQQSARQLSFQLASSGMTVISGLARGIDTFAHEGAIAAKGRTVAVIGSGLGQLYPPENMALAERIADGNGAVVSEFSLNTKPDKKTFPMRNRIVANWAEGVLVIECPEWSGSLITANLANEAGKQVYAVPGQIDRPSSAGCNQLIRNGATLVTKAQDILEDFSSLPLLEMENGKTSAQPVALNLTDQEQSILDALKSDDLLVDQLISHTQLPFPQLSVTLMQLELKRLVQQLPGQRYALRK